MCFFASRRRHRGGALVTGVQTGALPISLFIKLMHQVQDIARGAAEPVEPQHDQFVAGVHKLHDRFQFRAPASRGPRSGLATDNFATRSEERRVGKECISSRRSRWSPFLSTTKYSESQIQYKKQYT